MSKIITSKGLKIVLPLELAESFTSKTILEGIKITQVSPNTISVFMNCVLLTDEQHLLIYQKRLFSKKCNLRFNIKLTDQLENSDLNLKKNMVKGVLSFSISKKDIECNQSGVEYAYKLYLPDSSWLTSGQYLKFTLPHKMFD